MVKIFAHRGLRATYPENTLLAFQKALELGVYGIELDVQLTRDGHVVIIHDEMLTRTTSGNGAVWDTEFNALRKLDAGRGERVPELVEYFDLIRGLSVMTNIEFKNNLVPYKGMEEKVLSLIREYKLSDRVILSSFRIESVKKLRVLAPEMLCGFIVNEIFEPDNLAAMMKEQGITYLHPSTYCYARHRKNIRDIPVNVWTVNDEAEMRKLAADGVNGVFTDNPALMQTILDEMSAV